MSKESPESTQLSQEKQALERRILREKKRVEKRLQKNESDLAEALSWERLQHEALLLQSNFFRLKRGMQSITLPDWDQEGKELDIALDSTVTPEEDLKKRFVRVRKLKRSIPYIQKYRLENLQAIEACDQKIVEVNQAQSLEDLKKFHRKPPALKTTVPSPGIMPYREYTSSAGIKIWVGKSAAKNDLLTFSFARGLDWWLHVSGFSGSHVVIRSSEPDPETVLDALQLALHYSKAKLEGRADVCMTQKKHVARLKVPGKVQISNYKTIHVKLDPHRFEALKNRGLAF